METLFIDSRMGISANKLMGALIDVLDNPEAFIRRFNDMGMEGIRVERHKDGHSGIVGSKISFIRVNNSNDMYADEIDDDEPVIKHSHSRRHTRRFADVKEIIDDLPLNGKIRKKAVNIYETITKASAEANNREIGEVKLHRTGSRNVIGAVVAVCMLLDDTEFDQIIASPIATGTGYAYTSKGNLPIPIPTLQKILGDIPYFCGNEEGEICTLEGAAILKEFADRFEDMPELAVIRTGAGIGERDFKTGVNCTRVTVGKIIETTANDTIAELEAIIHSYNAEELKLVGEKLAALGVKESYINTVSMLNGTSCIVLKCICENEIADAAAAEILKNTSALSVRRNAMAAYQLKSVYNKISTSIGEINVVKMTGFGVSKSEPLNADVVKLAKDNNITVHEANAIINKEI